MLETIIKILGIIAGSRVLSAVIVPLTERGKKRAEAADIFTNAAKKILDEQNGVIEDVKKDLSDTQERLETEKARSDTPEEQLHSLLCEIAELREEHKLKAIFQAVGDPILII